MNNLFKLLFVLLAVFCVTEATHFRFGSVSWAPTTAHNIIKFTTNFAFRTTYFKTSTSDIIVGEKINLGALSFGDGTSTSVTASVTSFDIKNDWFSGQFIFTKTYTALAKNTTKQYLAMFTSCCRISTLLNNKDSDWNITSSVYLDYNTWPSVNYSPVSGMLPIVQVIANKNNNFRVIASDPNVNDKLTFSFSTVYPMTQPSGMKINSTGHVYFLPTQIGLYSTQIYITDDAVPPAYSVVDFILESIAEPGKCDPSCSNSGATCNANTDCKNCANSASTTVNTCSTTNYPPFFVSPTPEDNALIPFTVGQSNTINLQCKSNYSTRTVGIQAANVPSGANLAQGTSTQGVVTNTLTWTPVAANVGVYVTSIFCYDSNGLTSNSRSFTIFIAKPECGNGKKNDVTGKCECVGSQWDPNSNCFDCSSGYYGQNCDPTPPCDKGVPNEGILGDGKCMCINGYSGSKCDIPLSQSCKDMKNTVLISTTVPSFYVNPSKVQLYIESDFALSTSLNVPLKLSKVDVFVLVDVNVATSTLFGIVQSSISTFVNDVSKGICETTQFGIGYFSDALTSGFNFAPGTIIGSNIVNTINSYSVSSYSSNSSGNSLLGSTGAASNANGWNTGSFKSIVIITDSDHSSNSTFVNSFISAYVSNSIAPVVIGFGASSIPNWASAISTADFGYSAVSLATASDISAKAVAGLKSVLSTVVYKTDNTTNGASFVKTTPSDIAVSTTSDTVKNVTGLILTKPTNTAIASPVASISAIGFGQTDFSLNYNRPPVATASAFSVNQNSFTTFKLTGTDPDFNILTFKFTSTLLSGGIITDSNNIDVSTQNKYYPSTEVFKFSVATNYLSPISINFIANDGCVDSAPSTVSITIIRVNQLPTCSQKTISPTINVDFKFFLNADDFEDVSPKLVFIKPTDLTAYGSLTYNGVAVTSTTSISNGTEIIFKQTVNPTNNVDVPVTFQAVDSSGAISTSTCTLTVKLVHTNIAPVSSSATPVSVIPRGNVSLTLVSTDSDSTSATFTIKKVTNGAKGTFYSCSTGDCLCATGSAGRTDITDGKQYSTISYSNKVANQLICFLNEEPAAVSNYASISFISTDNQGLDSTSVTVVVNIVGNRANNPPVATPIQPYSCYQDYLDSAVHQVTGTDPDIDDYNPNSIPPVNNLIAIITTAPTHGILVTVVNGSTVATQGNAPLNHYYRPNPGYSGTDSYSYQVMDTFKATSPILTTTVTINPINHKPSVVVSSYSFTSQSGGSVTQTLATSDKDGDKVICSVISIPSQISMYDSEGNLITSVPTDLKSNTYSFDFPSPSTITPTPYTNVSSTFTISCKDVTTLTFPYGSLSTGNVVANVQYTYINTPPSSQGGTVQLDQDTTKSFTVNGSDIESPSSDLQVKILSLPINGKLLITSTGEELTSLNTSSTKYTLSQLSYKPNAGLSNWNTFDQQSPLDSISYIVVDPQGLSSDSEIISFSVRPRNPPVYTGAEEIDVLQNTRYPLTITGKVGNGGSQVNIQVISFTGNGTFYIAHNMGSEGTMDQEITSYPNDQTGSTSYNYAYKPPHNKYGPKFDYIYFKLYDGDLYSELYNVTVNVIHVNQPPTIELISYKILDGDSSEILFGNSSLINMNTNTSVLIKYAGSDIDVDQVTPLNSLVSNVPLRGLLYAYDPTASNSSKALISRSFPKVYQNPKDGYYYVVFVPTKGTAAESYAKVPFVMIDNGGLMSPTALVSINVNTVNIAPYVLIGNKNYTTQTNLTLSVLGVQFDDPDSVNNNVSIIVSIVGEKDDIVAPLTNVQLSFTQSSMCNYDKTLASVSCIGTKKALNSSITSISVTASTAGNYRLKLFVDDLGYNAPAAVRDISHLNATGYVEIKVNAPETTTQTTNNKTVLTGAIAGAAAGAALLAAGLWKLLRKAAPPTDTFFSEAAFLGDGVNANPLYEQSATAAENPLYQSASENTD
ncbi:hypothetical protein RB653_008436 [Dictyostelium firmibasis]|uniref:VWFA domain-containing protein n=1 Tax=Dictyostelium firmibasis TaxID=79012 RepID=A0AAN7UCL0_9MYCE